MLYVRQPWDQMSLTSGEFKWVTNVSTFGQTAESILVKEQIAN